jgi:hypothetical protein
MLKSLLNIDLNSGHRDDKVSISFSQLGGRSGTSLSQPRNKNRSTGPSTLRVPCFGGGARASCKLNLVNFIPSKKPSPLIVDHLAHIKSASCVVISLRLVSSHDLLRLPRHPTRVFPSLLSFLEFGRDSHCKIHLFCGCMAGAGLTLRVRVPFCHYLR